MGLLEALLVAIAGLAEGFVNTLAGNGTAFTLPALEFFGLPNEVANGTNRFSIIAVGLVGTCRISSKSGAAHRRYPSSPGLASFLKSTLSQTVSLNSGRRSAVLQNLAISISGQRFRVRWNLSSV